MIGTEDGGGEMSFEKAAVFNSSSSNSEPRSPGLSNANLTARIVYIDDEESLLLLIRRSLTRRGHTVSGYLSAREALDDIVSAPDRYDIVITDLNMPDMSGLDLSKELRSRFPHLPILLTSGFVTDQIVRDAKDAGINQVVEKPSSLDELSLAIQSILEHLTVQRTLK